MKFFETPELEVVNFTTEDIITASAVNNTVFESDIPGGPKDPLN